MIIVAGHLIVEPGTRESYLASCVEVVEQARRTPGCLDFSVTADLVQPDRVNVFERWDSHDAVEVFRGAGPNDEQAAVIRAASVAEYEVASEQSLT